MTAFLTSFVVMNLMIVVIFLVGWLRPPGKPLTWGEAFVGALWVFAMMVMAYGVLPDQWLRWADGELGWRADKVGIPTGPLPVNEEHLLFQNGIHIPFTGGKWYGTKGKITVTAETIRDIVATGLYIQAFVGQLILWWWWQRRGRAATKRKQRAIAGESAYGRPLKKTNKVWA